MDSYPPPPTPHGSFSIFHFTTSNSSYSNSNFPILAIAIIGILATAFLLVSYYIFVIKCCLNFHRTDYFRRSRHNPIPTITTESVPRGLDESLIRLIPVIHFRKEATEKMKQGEESEETEHFECAICLNDFNEGEKLRVIPNCCHAFHIDCIDVWLQNNASCPVCRSTISSNSLCAIDSIPKNPDPTPLELTQIPSLVGNDDEDFVVIEIRRNNELDDCDSEALSTFSIAPSPWKSSLDDECIRESVKDESFDRVHPIRRSISMDSPSHRQHCWEIRKVTQGNESEGSNSRGLRRSCFAFGGVSRNAVLPLRQFDL